MLELLFVHYLALYRVSIYYLLSLYVLLSFYVMKKCRNKLNLIELKIEIIFEMKLESTVIIIWKELVN